MNPPDYKKLPIEDLLDACHSRLTGFSCNFNVLQKPSFVMFNFNYDFRHPMSTWQRVRPTEIAMGGIYPSIRDCLTMVLDRVDRFDAWTKEESAKAEAKKEANIRAHRAALATPVAKPEEVDEGDETIETEELPEIKPLLDTDPGKPSLN